MDCNEKGVGSNNTQYFNLEEELDALKVEEEELQNSNVLTAIEEEATKGRTEPKK